MPHQSSSNPSKNYRFPLRSSSLPRSHLHPISHTSDERVRAGLPSGISQCTSTPYQQDPRTGLPSEHEIIPCTSPYRVFTPVQRGRQPQSALRQSAAPSIYSNDSDEYVPLSSIGKFPSPVPSSQRPGSPYTGPSVNRRTARESSRNVTHQFDQRGLPKSTPILNRRPESSIRDSTSSYRSRDEIISQFPKVPSSRQPASELGSDRDPMDWFGRRKADESSIRDSTYSSLSRDEIISQFPDVPSRRQPASEVGPDRDPMDWFSRRKVQQSDSEYPYIVPEGRSQLPNPPIHQSPQESSPSEFPYIVPDPAGHEESGGDPLDRFKNRARKSPITQIPSPTPNPRSRSVTPSQSRRAEFIRQLPRGPPPQVPLPPLPGSRLSRHSSLGNIYLPSESSFPKNRPSMKSGYVYGPTPVITSEVQVNSRPRSRTNSITRLRKLSGSLRRMFRRPSQGGS